MSTFSQRIHPLVAVAAISVTLASGLGIAAMTGILPASRGNAMDAHQATVVASPDLVAVPSMEVSQPGHAKPMPPQKISSSAPQRPMDATSAPPSQHKAVAQNSPVGIGVGALIGGVIGNQFGSGDGKALATIAGAIGGGYVGNEVAKKNPPQP